ncbi:MAG: hypothetical protein OHK93_007656 [Ramalina farinacea]|uniref:Uncharacterized protein n=1 Tax=Ramalina farinacea TaxID=258253 RepID=A0AA43QNS8_9LECA|nr:hypothetical protein [Ramalina farinacea]
MQRLFLDGVSIAPLKRSPPLLAALEHRALRFITSQSRDRHTGTSREHRHSKTSQRVQKTAPSHVISAEAYREEFSLPDTQVASQFPASGEDVGSKKTTVKWFHQAYPWSKHRRPADPENPDIADETGEVKLLKQEIDQLDDELRHMQGEGGSVGTFIEPLLQNLSPEDRQSVKQGIEKHQELRKSKAEALAAYLTTLEIKWALPAEQISYLRRLNAQVREVATKPQSQTCVARKRLWRSWERCKAFLPGFLQLVPTNTWNVMFKAQANAAMQDDPTWASHLLILIDDMRIAGQELHPQQSLLYVEALRFVGREDEAIEEWQRLRNMLENDTHVSTEYELLGVRLFVSQGNLEKAEEVASTYLQAGHGSESRILIPVMDAWLQRQEQDGLKPAWALYLRLRMQLGDDMNLKDYDSVCLSFLREGHMDIAVAVFKDMMLMGQASSQDSVNLYKKSMGLLGKVEDGTITTLELDKVGLTAITVLPKSFQNKYFYAGWMKRLIGMDEADSAAAVVKLMYAREITPDAMHLNGIIGAWMRTKSDNPKSEAEKMAWAMIRQRLDFVQKRKRQASPAPLQDPGRGVSVVPIPHHVERHTPAASIETFSLLLRYYTQRAKYEQVHMLQQVLELAEIRPNSFWINHLLCTDLRRGEHTALWKRYLSMPDSKVTPDMDTFTCLWDCQRAHLACIKTNKASCQIPGPRNMMCQMLNWLHTLGEFPRKAAVNEFSKELYETILACMARAHDLPGTIVTLYGLRDVFGLHPDGNTMQSICKLIADLEVPWTGSGTISTPRRRAITRTRGHAWAKKTLQHMQFKRARNLAVAGYDDYEELNEHIQQEERLFLLAEFLRTMMGRLAKGKGLRAITDIETAAIEMGIEGLNLEDPLLS